MGTIVIHAGMPKTGSTSLQRWLAKECRPLVDEHGVRVVVARPGPRRLSRRAVILGSPGLGHADSGRLGESLASGVSHARDLALCLCARLDESTEDASTTVLSSEALAACFIRPD